MNLGNISPTERRQTKKRTCSVIPFIRSPRTGKTNLWCPKGEQWLPVTVGTDERGRERTFWYDGTVSYLGRSLRFRVNTCHKSCGSVPLRWVCFSPCIFVFHLETSRCQLVSGSPCPALLSDGDEGVGYASVGQGAYGWSLHLSFRYSFVANLKLL